jgi:hypothetical protein
LTEVRTSRLDIAPSATASAMQENHSLTK